MIHPAIDKLGRPVGKIDGTLYLHWNIIEVTQCISIKLEVNASLKPLSSPHRGGNAISIKKRLGHRGCQAIYICVITSATG
jgi:hypothetical protein